MSWFYIFLKDLKMYVKDFQAWIFNFITPIVIITIAGLALSSFISPDDQSIDVLVVNHDPGEESREVIKAFSSKPAINVMEMDEETAKQMLLNEEVAVLIEIPEQFTKTAKEIRSFAEPVSDGSKLTFNFYFNPMGMEAIGYVHDAFANVLDDLFSFSLIKKAINSQTVNLNAVEIDGLSMNVAASLRKKSDLYEINMIQYKKSSQLANPFDFFVPGFAVMFLLFGISNSAMGLLKEEEEGTLKRLFVAPISKGSILFGKMLNSIFDGIVQITALLLFGYFVFDMSVGQDLLALALLVFSLIIACTGLGTLLSSLARSTRQANAFSVIVIIGMSALGGSWWPLFMVPDVIRKIAHFTTITAWAMDGFNKLMIHGESLPAVTTEIIILTAAGILFFSIGLLTLKRRRTI